jgi:hypothetical protein
LLDGMLFVHGWAREVTVSESIDVFYKCITHKLKVGHLAYANVVFKASHF